MNFSKQYKTHGVDNFYRIVKDSYKNPHEEIIRNLVQQYCTEYDKILDLACGSGEVTRALSNVQIIHGADPFLSELYTKQTGRKVFNLSFEQIADYGLDEKYDAIICSFALHLVQPSRLNLLLWQLSQVSNNLYIISPTKRTDFNHNSWNLSKHIIYNRIHFKHYSVVDIAFD